MESEFDYKKYSLEKFRDWTYDILDGDATAEEIYYTFKQTICENIDYHQKYLKKNQELLNLLEGKKTYGTI